MEGTERGVCRYGLRHGATNPYTDADQDATFCTIPCRITPDGCYPRECGRCLEYQPPGVVEDVPPMPGMIEY